MAESTLSLKRADFQQAVGIFLGYGAGADATPADTAWTGDQQRKIDLAVSSGLRTFYFPVLDGGATHHWSFLKPVVTLTLAAGDTGADLPDDFGGFEGEVAVSQAGGGGFQTLALLSDELLRAKYAAFPDAAGWPQFAAVAAVKGTAAAASSRYQLTVYPAADGAYALRVGYYVLPDNLTGGLPYAYGGAAHVETIREACLAAAEQQFDDAATLHTAKFRERLLASVAYDRKLKPKSLGYNGDRSDRMGWDEGWAGGRYGVGTITFDGIDPN